MLRFFLGSHTRRCPTKWALQLAHTPPPRPSSVCLLAWCGFAAPLSTSTAERTDFQGFGTTSTRWAGPLQLQPAGHVGSPSSTQTKTTRRARDDDAIATRLEADLLPRSGLCSPSPMAQAEPPMAWPAMRPSFLATWTICLLSFQGRPGSSCRSLTLPPARVAPPAPSLALQSAGNAHVDGWRVTFTPTGWQASHRVQPDRTPAATESL